MYPDPKRLLSFLHDRGLYVGANLHDAQGVMPVESQYNDMANFTHQSDGKVVTFHISNKIYADGLHQTVLEPLAADGGFDFWWTDWQQGGWRRESDWGEIEYGVGDDDISEILTLKSQKN